MKNSLLVTAMVLFTALTGCAGPQGKIILLPQEDGTPSAVVVRAKAGERVLDQPYATASVGARSVELGSTTADEVHARYRPVMEALPVRARSYTLNYEFGKTALTKESRLLLDTILKDMQELPAPELIVIGHTDEVGSDATNDRLALERANSVLALIKAKGIALRDVSVVGRGKREPLVKGRPGIPESRNRRVEIRVK